MDTQAVKLFLTTTAAAAGVKILTALIFWFVGRWLIGRVVSFVRAAMNRNAADTNQNYSALPARRVDRTAQLASGVDPFDAIVRLRAAVAKIPNVATDPAPEVSLLDMTLIGAVIAVRPYTHTAHYWQVYFDTNEAIVREARAAGWPAPTPSQIVRQA